MTEDKIKQKLIEILKEGTMNISSLDNKFWREHFEKKADRILKEIKQENYDRRNKKRT